MARDRRIRRAQIAAGIILGLIVGTIHALVVHVTAGDEAAGAVVLQPIVGVAADHEPSR